MSISDWLPTLYSAAGGSAGDLGNIDGVNMWPALVENMESPRKTVLHNIDDSRMISALRVGDYKLLKGSNYNGKWNGWFGPTGREQNNPQYNVNAVRLSPTSVAFQKAGFELPNDDKIWMLRKEADVAGVCLNNNETESCDPSWQVCLFNIKEDPCEQNNLAPSTVNLVKVNYIQISVLLLNCIPGIRKNIKVNGLNCGASKK